jgi:hypothetical protein
LLLAKGTSFFGTAGGVIPRIKIKYNSSASKICEAHKLAGSVGQAENRGYITRI